MAIDRNTQVIGVAPDLTLEQWARILTAKSALSADDINQGYQITVTQRVSPAFILACFWVESHFGTIGICHDYNTKSPGNTRTQYLTTIATGTARTPQGLYTRYASWADGFRDLAARLTYKPDYKGLTTIGQILPVFAPVGDNNNPVAYIQSVVDMINAWMQPGQEVSSTNMTLEIIDLSANTPSSVYTDRRGQTIQELILHDTAGKGDFNNKPATELQALLDATIHWFEGSGGVSIHYLIGPEKLGARVYRLCKEGVAAFHAVGNKGSIQGVSKDNCISIGIERFGQPNEAVGPNQRAAMLALATDICQRNGLNANQVISHMSIQSDRTDGNVLLAAVREVVANGGISKVTSENNGAKPPAPQFPTNKSMGGGFLVFYNSLKDKGLDLLTFGYPVTEEYDCLIDGKTRTVQLGQRAGLIYEPENAAPWDVHFMTVSQLETALDAAKSKALLN